jgi:hypothetical protein
MFRKKEQELANGAALNYKISAHKRKQLPR